MTSRISQETYKHGQKKTNMEETRRKLFGHIHNKWEKRNMQANIYEEINRKGDKRVYQTSSPSSCWISIGTVESKKLK